jgi:hypothetical protein
MEKAGPKKAPVRLHHEAKEISFKHKFIIETLFNKKINGILGIDYFSLFIIDSTETLSCYSSCPALEYNLIQSDLWIYDGMLSFTEENSKEVIMFWDKLYPAMYADKLINLKQKRFGFQFGFFIMKRINSMIVIYSFATKSNSPRRIYEESQDILSKIGDFFLEEIKPIYSQYICNNTKPKLQLVIDNSSLKNSKKAANS